MNNYDSWDNTDSALSAVFKLMYYMHENKPLKGSVEEVRWESELKEIRKWCISIHVRRIALNMQKKSIVTTT